MDGQRLAFIKRGAGTVKDKLTISKRMWEQGSKSKWLREGALRPLGPLMRSVGRSVGPRYHPTLGLHSINLQT